MSEFEKLVADLDAIRANREAAAKRKPMRKALDTRPVRFTDFAALERAAAEAARKEAASPEGVDRALRAKVERATSLLKAAVAGGSLTALQAATFEARINHLAQGLTVTEARLRAEQAR